MELWDALTRSNLKEKVASGKDGLEGHVVKGGER